MPAGSAPRSTDRRSLECITSRLQPEHFCNFLDAHVPLHDMPGFWRAVCRIAPHSNAVNRWMGAVHPSRIYLNGEHVGPGGWQGYHED